MTSKYSSSDLIESSSIHGISNVFRSKRLLFKIVWIILFTFGSGLCSFFVYQNIQAYFEFNVNTKLEMIYQVPLTFPAVTFCNLNPYIKNYSIDFAKTIFDNQTWLDYLNTLENLKKFSNSTEALNSYLKFEGYFNDLFMKAKTNPRREEFGLDFKEMFLKCSFGYEECNENDFEKYYHYFFGNCFIFNSGKNLKTINRASKMDSLTVELFLGLEYNSLSFNQRSQGAVLMINENKEKALVNGWYEIPSGFETNIKLKKISFEKQSHPYSNCEKEGQEVSSLYKILAEIKEYYNQQDCFDLCIQQEYIKKCECYHTDIYSLDYKIPCTNVNQSVCIFNRLKELFNGQEFNSICLPKCPSKCGQTVYSPILTFTNYPSRSHFNLLKNYPNMSDRFMGKEITFEMVKENTLAVSVYFDELYTTRFTETPSISPLDLFSSIGGTMGLFWE